MNASEANDMQVDILRAELRRPGGRRTQLERDVVDFCSPQPRSWWDIDDKFGDHAAWAINRAVGAGLLERRMEPDGWVYRATFPGVDIDAAHRSKA